MVAPPRRMSTGAGGRRRDGLWRSRGGDGAAETGRGAAPGPRQETARLRATRPPLPEAAVGGGGPAAGTQPQPVAESSAGTLRYPPPPLAGDGEGGAGQPECAPRLGRGGVAPRRDAGGAPRAPRARAAPPRCPAAARREPIVSSSTVPYDGLLALQWTLDLPPLASGGRAGSPGTPPPRATPRSRYPSRPWWESAAGDFPRVASAGNRELGGG